MHIIAGKYKNLKLRYPKNIRPTSGKVREAVFAKLRDIVEDAEILDLYAGSGAYGIEGISRGARSAVFVDNFGASIKAVKNNLRAVGLHMEVKRQDVLKFIAADNREFDLVFMDPPYDRLDARAVRSAGNLLKNKGILVLEISKRIKIPDIPMLELIDSGRWGDTLVGFYRKLNV